MLHQLGLFMIACRNPPRKSMGNLHINWKVFWPWLHGVCGGQKARFSTLLRTLWWNFPFSMNCGETWWICFLRVVRKLFWIFRVTALNGKLVEKLANAYETASVNLIMKNGDFSIFFKKLQSIFFFWAMDLIRRLLRQNKSAYSNISLAVYIFSKFQIFILKIIL